MVTSCFTVVVEIFVQLVIDGVSWMLYIDYLVLMSETVEGLINKNSENGKRLLRARILKLTLEKPK